MEFKKTIEIMKGKEEGKFNLIFKIEIFNFYYINLIFHKKSTARITDPIITLAIPITSLSFFGWNFLTT